VSYLVVMSTERLLREYVKEVLLKEEDVSAGSIMAMGADMNPYGVHYGSSDDLYKVFIKPFVDVVDTAAGKTKELSIKAQTLVKVAFETIVTSIIPVAEDSYKEIFASEKEALDKVKQEYADVYKSNWDAFKDNDVLCAAFMYSPTMLLTLAFAKKSPKAATRMISTLSGGTLDPWLGKISKKFGWNDSGPVQTGLGRSDNGPGPLMGEAHLSEKDGKKGDKKPAPKKPDPAELLSSDKVKHALAKSNVVQSMQKQGRAIVRKTLEQVYQQASAALKAKSLQDVQQKAGLKLKGLDKLAQLPPEERQKTEQMILQGAMKSLKSFYIKNLQAQVKQAVASGIDESSEYVQDFNNVIKKIQSL